MRLEASEEEVNLAITPIRRPEQSEILLGPTACRSATEAALEATFIGERGGPKARHHSSRIACLESLLMRSMASKRHVFVVPSDFSLACGEVALRNVEVDDPLKSR